MATDTSFLYDVFSLGAIYRRKICIWYRVETFRNKEKNAIFLPPAYEALKQFLMND